VIIRMAGDPFAIVSLTAQRRPAAGPLTLKVGNPLRPQLTEAGGLMTGH